MSSVPRSVALAATDRMLRWPAGFCWSPFAGWTGSHCAATFHRTIGVPPDAYRRTFRT